MFDYSIAKRLLPFSTLGLLSLTGGFTVGLGLGAVGKLALGLCQFGTGELAGGLRDEANALDILTEVVAEEGGRATTLNVSFKDGKVVDLDISTIEQKVADALHHVGEYALDTAWRVRGIVVGHVLDELIKGHWRIVDGTAVIHTIALGLGVVVLVLFNLNCHNLLMF